MPQRQVTIDGRKLGVVVMRGQPVMIFKQIAYAFGITEKVATNIIYKDLHNNLPPTATFIANKDDCIEAGIPLRKGKYPRMFTMAAIIAMRDQLIKKTTADRYYDILEQYFDTPVILPLPEVTAKERNEDDEILDLATKIVADRKKSLMLKNTINDAIKKLKVIVDSLEAL